MTTDQSDPFSAENYNIIQFVQLSRIYDVLLTLVQLQNPTAAERLISAHAAGKLVAPSPDYTGDFLFDEENSSNSDQ